MREILNYRLWKARAVDILPRLPILTPRPARPHRRLWLPLLIVLSTSTLASAQGAGPAPAAPAGNASRITPAQARQTLDVLQDAKKRAQLIETLKTIAKASTPEAQAAPAASSPTAGAAKLAIPLAPQSLGAQLLVTVSGWLANASHQVAESARAVTNFPLIWRWLVHIATDPSARGEVLDVIWKLAVALGCALAAEWVAARIVRRPFAALEAVAAKASGGGHHGGEAGDGGAPPEAHDPKRRGRHPHLHRAWQLLRLLPLALARLVLELIPVVAFAVVGNLLLGTPIGSAETPRLVILAVVNAYVVCRGIMCVTRMLVSPANGRLRLLHTSDETAAYVEVWMRRLVVVVVFGFALAEVALLLGLSPVAHQALVKLVSLVAHLFLVVIVLQSRRAVARSIRAAEGRHGAVAVMRNRLGDVWHLIAIFFIIALWIVWAINVRNGALVLVHYFVVTVAVLIVARLIAILALGTLDRIFRIGPDLARRFPGLEARANRYYPVLRGTLSAIVAVVAAVALLEIWGVNALDWFSRGEIGGRLVSAVVTIGVTAAAAIAVWEGANIAMERQLAKLTRESQFVRSARLRTLLPMVRTALLVTVLAVVALTALSEIGVNIGPLLAGAGIVGIAVGFGSQKLVQDLITGIFLLLENAMQVGDWVTVAGLSGSVENLSIRTIRLRATDGSVHIIPFSSVTSVTNTNRGIGRATISVNVAYGEDTDRVGDALKEIALEMRQDPAFKDAMRSDFNLWGVDNVGGSVVTIIGQLECTDTGRWVVQREFNRRMKRRFQELGIELANPTQTVVLQPPPGAPADADVPEEGRDAAGAAEAAAAASEPKPREKRGLG